MKDLNVVHAPGSAADFLDWLKDLDLPSLTDVLRVTATVRMTLRFLDAVLGGRLPAIGDVVGSEAERVPLEATVVGSRTP